MTSFRHYFESDYRHDLLCEMPRPKKDASNFIEFDEYDDAYLSKFGQDPSVLAWALDYRYGPDVLGNVNDEDPRDIPYQKLQYKPGARPRGSQQNGKVLGTAKGVPINKEQLEQKIKDKGIDPSSLNFSYKTLFERAKDYAGFLQGTSPERPKLVYDPKAVRQWRDTMVANQERSGDHYQDEKPEVTDKEVVAPVTITLAPEDRLYLNGIPPVARATALALRYSDYFFTHPEYKGKDLINLTVSVPGMGEPVTVRNVSLVFDDLQKRWEELKAKGWDFQKSPMTTVAARKLIKGETYTANYRKKGGQVHSDKDRLAELRQQYAQHLKDPENAPNPNVEDPANPTRDRNKDFMAMIFDEAKIAYDYVAGKLMHQRGLGWAMTNRWFKAALDEDAVMDMVVEAAKTLASNYSGHERFPEEKFRVATMVNLIWDQMRKFVTRFARGKSGDEKGGYTKAALDQFKQSKQDRMDYYGSGDRAAKVAADDGLDDEDAGRTSWGGRDDDMADDRPVYGRSFGRRR